LFAERCQEVLFEDKIVVTLPDSSFTCDLDDINVVEDYLWYSNEKGYVMARIDGKTRTFHNFITNNDDPFHVNTEFINNNPVNCRKSNLRLVSKRVANIACHQLQQNNTSGITGVHYDQHHRNWTAAWKDEQGDRHTKSFAVIKYGPAHARELAIEYRSRMIRELLHYANGWVLMNRYIYIIDIVEVSFPAPLLYREMAKKQVIGVNN